MADPAKTLSDLRPNPKNPRTITDKKRRMLDQAMRKFGDLSGIVRNRRSGNLVSGHQRRAALEAAGTTAVHIERTYKQPTASHTLAEGYVELNGERFAYREVDLSPALERAANLASNQNAGSWDMALLAGAFDELSLTDLDLSLTMFAESERASLIEAPQAPAEGQEPRPSAQICCPSCGHEFYRSEGAR